MVELEPGSSFYADNYTSVDNQVRMDLNIYCMSDNLYFAFPGLPAVVLWWHTLEDQQIAIIGTKVRPKALSMPVL